jgi:hypothetical protein
MSVTLPNGESIKTTQTVDLPFKHLFPGTRHAYVLPHLTTHSLVSVPKLADAGYTTVFHPGYLGMIIHSKRSISIWQQCKPVLQGWRDENGLWQLGYNGLTLMSKQVKQIISPNGTRLQETTANAYSLPSIAQVIKHQHAAAGFPVKETWLKAILCGNCVSWPGVTATNVKKYCPESVES